MSREGVNGRPRFQIPLGFKKDRYMLPRNMYHVYNLKISIHMLIVLCIERRNHYYKKTRYALENVWFHYAIEIEKKNSSKEMNALRC